MARTRAAQAQPEVTEEQMQEAYKAGRRGKPCVYEPGLLFDEWQRGHEKHMEDEDEKREIEPEDLAEPLAEFLAVGSEQRKSRRTVAPGEAPKQYSGSEWPRGGHVRLNNEDEEEFCWAKPKRFQQDGALWIDSAFCGRCADIKQCSAYKTYRKHLREEYGI